MDKDKLLRQYLDGELSPKEERQALHIIADDDDMRAMLRFEQKLSTEFTSAGSIDIPDDFTDKVMHRIEQKESANEAEPISEVIRNWFEQLLRPQQVIWRPVYGVALVLLVLFSLGYPLFLSELESPEISEQSSSISSVDQSVQQISTGAEEVMLRFIYIDEDANSVAVAGDFSDWEPIELNRQQVNGEQVWSGIVSMSRGEHNYMFLKDGSEWITDPMAPVTRDDGFGNKNAVVYL